MSLAAQALAVARLDAGAGTTDDRARVLAWDRLNAMLSTLDSKTSVLLRFNAIVVAALAYLMLVRGADPFAEASATAKLIGTIVSHAALIASVASCGFAFPVINVQWNFFGGRIDRSSDEAADFDDTALERLGTLVAQRTRLYSRAWQLAVAGGIGFAVLVAAATIH